MFRLQQQLRLAIGNKTNGAKLCARKLSSASATCTALYDFHVKYGGRMVDFGGYMLPVQYKDQGIALSHLHTRQHASIFDVSHMLQSFVRGKDAVACMESICTADVRGLAAGTGTLTVFTNACGGILDDLIILKINEHVLYVVSNAAMKQQDMEIMESAASEYRAAAKDVQVEFLPTSEQSLIAVQGPAAVSALAKLLPTKQSEHLTSSLHFMETMSAEVSGVPDCRITRCGYTGEDGVEVSVPSTRVRHMVEALLTADTKVKLAGLGARDSLRLEAGLCLYGSDIDSETTPVEAGLAWLVAKRRRNEKNFPGALQIIAQLQSGETPRRRIGLIMQSADRSTPLPPARSGTEILHNKSVVGHVTSGCPSPCLRQNIAMGYVSDELKQPGTLLQLKIRNNLHRAIVTKMPFVKTQYFVKAKNL